MITADKIVFDERKDKDTGDIHMRARVEISRVVNVSKYEETNAGVRMKAKEMLQHAVWREIYGELASTIAQLETVILQEVEHPQLAQQLVAQIRAAMPTFEPTTAEAGK